MSDTENRTDITTLIELTRGKFTEVKYSGDADLPYTTGPTVALPEILSALTKLHGPIFYGVAIDPHNQLTQFNFYEGTGLPSPSSVPLSVMELNPPALNIEDLASRTEQIENYLQNILGNLGETPQSALLAILFPNFA